MTKINMLQFLKHREKLTIAQKHGNKMKKLVTVVFEEFLRLKDSLTVS
jgi:hypothetical protein